ncbi:MAG: HAD-IA family hydrolase [Desulfovibrio sp.]|nr:HAD-IA family hydrolase [Desulfovibrio sp.]
MSGVFFPHGLGGVVFDCDGVMIDSREANNIFYNRVLAYFGLPPMTPEQERYSFMATGMQALLHIVPPHLHGQIAYVISHCVIYDRDIVPLLRLRPGFRDFVQELWNRAVRMAVHTNRTLHGIQTVLDIFSLPSYFSPVIASDTAEPKPSPEGAVRICEAWGCAPASVLFVGDSDHDKKTAEGAGLVFAAMGDSDLRGQINAKNFDELLAALADSLPPVVRR